MGLFSILLKMSLKFGSQVDYRHTRLRWKEYLLIFRGLRDSVVSVCTTHVLLCWVSSTDWCPVGTCGTSSKPMLLYKIAFCPHTFKSTLEILISVMYNLIVKRHRALGRQQYPTFSHPNTAEAIRPMKTLQRGVLITCYIKI